MLSKAFSLYVLVLLCLFVHCLDQTIPVTESIASTQEHFERSVREETQHLRVAVIGAGAAGASFAHHLHRLRHRRLSSLVWDIEVFEKTARVGGRATTVNVFGDPNLIVEVGASIFIKENRILTEAVREFDLETSDGSVRSLDTSPQRLGVWDGDAFRLIIDEQSSWWGTFIQLIWKYGLSILRVRFLADSALKSFLRMYDQPVFPFPSLYLAARQAGLQHMAAQYADAFFSNQGVSPNFALDIVQASTRANYAQNISTIHALGALTCMSIQGATSVQGGNWQIFARMLRGANATIHQNTVVTEIRRSTDGKILVAFTKDDRINNDWQAYDKVVIAAPFETSGIDSYVRPRKSPPYVALHVTIFATSSELSPRYFGMLETDHVPETVLTTLNSHHQESPSCSSAPPFFSISLIRIIEPAESPLNNKQFVYKIFSATNLTDSFVLSLLDQTVDQRGLIDSSSTTINWIHRKTWQSYPYLEPVEAFQDARLDSNLWYTGGMESLISAMESMALMGKNVAHLMYAEAEANAEFSKPAESIIWGPLEVQKPL